MDSFNNSIILVVNNIEDSLNLLLPNYPIHSTRVIKNEEKDEFQIAQANQAIKEAYISSNDTKYLFLCGATFRIEAQNALLKILEEPPRNVVFIILVSSKNSLLSTIYSRLPYKNLKKSIVKDDINLDIQKLDLKDIYSFIKDNQRVTKDEAINIVESILLKINKENIKLNKEELDIFFKSIRLLELNSKPSNILTYLLLSILERENNK
ncbi:MULTISPECIES: DNA polymerase III subunit delta' [Arcobacteraceae]|uniref:DNA polymerase III subunit delta' n=1 Tax=Arcobacteraceae TaxID=2808963 RepID=UPI000DE9805A|nr:MULTISPECIES: DNA polymerase III subunit delta' [Arcobacteraceae]MBL3520096.1 DNA polymerase III subunit delta' [Aliarcobacter lanthieri]RBQ26697.1 DNA polymerase III subunit delta' [Arcobacter sp. CECT 9188]